MATAKRVTQWNPAHHPRDARGRFTKSSTRVLKAADAKRAKAAIAGFKPADMGPGGGDGPAWLAKQAAAGMAADDAVKRYFAGGWKATHSTLRTKKDAAQDPDVVALDKAMTPLSEDVMLERRVSLKMFAHIPLERLQGMKVRDAAYQPAALQGSQGEAPDGMVTIHMAVPAGTKALINPDTGAVVLDRDTETAISRVEANGRGGYDLYGVVIPRQGAARPAAGDGDQLDGTAPAAGPDGGDPGDRDPSTATGGPDTAGGTTPPAKKAAVKKDTPADDTVQDLSPGAAPGARISKDDAATRMFGTDGAAAKKAAAKKASTAGRRPAPAARRRKDDEPADSTPSRAGDDDDAQGAQAADEAATAAAAAQIAATAADHEATTGRPAPERVDQLERNDHVRIAGTNSRGERKTMTGYVSTPNTIGGQTWLTVSQFPDSQGRRVSMRVDPADPVSVQPHPTDAEIVLYRHPKTKRPLPNATYVDEVRKQAERDPEREAQAKARVAELAGVDQPADVEDTGPGGKLGEMSPVDRAELGVHVEDAGPGIFQSPLVGGSFSSVGRYVGESSTTRALVDKYGPDTVWGAAEQWARAHPEVMARTHLEVKARIEARRVEAEARFQDAVTASQAGDFPAAYAAIDAGELVDPTHKVNFRGWDDARAILARIEAKRAAERPAPEPVFTDAEVDQRRAEMAAARATGPLDDNDKVIADLAAKSTAGTATPTDGAYDAAQAVEVLTNANASRSSVIAGYEAALAGAGLNGDETPELAALTARVTGPENRIRAAVEDYLAERSLPADGFVDLSNVRDRLPDTLDRETVDQALTLLNRADATLIAEANQKTLTPQRRAAAVNVGNQDKHLIKLTGGDRADTLAAAAAVKPAQGDAGPATPDAPATGAPTPLGTMPAGFVAREDRPEYRKNYFRGWQAAKVNNPKNGLEQADVRGEPDAWYDAWGDYVASEEKFFTARRSDAEEADRLNGDQPYVLQPVTVDPVTGDTTPAGPQEDAQGLNSLNFLLRANGLAELPAGTAAASGQVDVNGRRWVWGPPAGRDQDAPDDAAPAADVAQPAAAALAPVGTSPLGEDLTTPPPDPDDRLNPEISQPTRDKYEGHGRPRRVIWFGDGTKPKKRGEIAVLTQGGTGKSATVMVRGEGDSTLLRRQSIGDRMWIAPVDAPARPDATGRDDDPAGAPRSPLPPGMRPNPFEDPEGFARALTDNELNAAAANRMTRAEVQPALIAEQERRRVARAGNGSTAGTPTPAAEAGPTASVGDRIPANVAELLEQPETGPSDYHETADRLTWPAELSTPRVAATELVDGQEIAIVQYATISKPSIDAPATLDYSDQFYAVPADTRMRPLSMSFHTRDGYYGQPGDGRAAAGVTTNTASPVGPYRNMHLASGKTASAALSGARAAIAKKKARERFTPDAMANVGVHSQADFDALDPNARIQVGDLIVLRSFNKLRTGVATRVTGRKVDALVSTPTGAYDTWYGTAEIGVGARLLRARNLTTPAPAAAPAVPAPDPGAPPSLLDLPAVPDVDAPSTAGTSAPASPAEARTLAGANQARTKMFDAIAAAMADPEARYPADIDPDTLGRLDDAGMIFQGRLTNRAAQQFTIARGEQAVRDAVARDTSTPVADQDARRDLISDSLAGAQAAALAEAVDTAVDAAPATDPVDARAQALEAKRAELTAARKAVETVPEFGGSSKRKSFAVRVDANIRRTAEAFRKVERLEREVKALERPPAPTAPKGGFTPDQLKNARVIKTRFGWHEVVKVNTKSVKVKAAPGMDDLVPIKRIIDARDNDGKRVDAPNADAPAVDAPEITDAGAPAPSITADADPVALAAGTSDDDLDAAFGPLDTPAAPSTAGTSAPGVDLAAIHVDDQVRVAGQWAPVTALVGDQYRVRLGGNLTLVSASDIRGHKPTAVVVDMFGATTAFVGQDRSTIGVATRADVGRTRGAAAVQQVSMFDVADQVQHQDQGALLDAFMQMPAAEAPASVPTLAPDAPEPARVEVPDDLTGWTDEQLSGLFAEVSAQAEYDEPGTLAILGEWERREAEMQAVLAMVPDDLSTLDDQAAADLFAEVTSHHGTMDTDVVARLEADLDRRDREHVAALADREALQDLVDLPVAEHADDAALIAALNAAGELGDEDAAARILDEIDRRDQEERAQEAAQAAEDYAQAAAEEAARVQAAAAEAAEANARAMDAPAEARMIVLEDLIAAADDADDASNAAAYRDDPAEPGMAEMSKNDLYTTAIAKLGSPEAAAARREIKRRNDAEARSQQTLENRRARRRLLNRDLTELTDEELTSLPALLDTLPGEDGATFRERKLADLRAEVTRRQQALDDKAARRAAGPDRGYRRADPVSEYDDLEFHFQSRHGEDAGRWQEAKELALGLQREPDRFSPGRLRPVALKEWKKAVQADPRAWPDIAQSSLAWYRHLTEIDAPEQAEIEGRARDYSTHGGWASQTDVPELLDPIAPADVAKADMVLYDMYRTAYAHRNAQGDESTVRRYTLAMARAYRIPHNPNASLAELNESGVGKKASTAHARDPRSPQRAAADVIAEFRRLAAEDGIDPADTERFGPADRKSTKRRAARGELTSDQQARIQAHIARGLTWDQAYAEAIGIDQTEMRRQAADDMIRQAFASASKDLAAAYRQAYTEHVMAAYEAAETGTSGHLLNDAGKQLQAKGKLSPLELFSGSSTRAYKYASEELKRWWGEHPPPRLTFAEWKANMQGDPAAMAAAIQKAKGNEFA